MAHALANTLRFPASYANSMLVSLPCSVCAAVAELTQTGGVVISKGVTDGSVHSPELQ
jgi:hypothetical protein